jgi:protein-disulfide isomerase
MRMLFHVAAAAALAMLPWQPLRAQEGITRQQGEEILKELRQIRQLLEEQGKGAPQEQTAKIRLNLEGFAMLGSKTAPLTIVEFTDYQCPFCQRFHTTAFPELKKNYIDTGKVRFYSKDLPLDMHANAFRAALAARCAAEQGQYWTLRDLMAANPDKLDLENIVKFGAQIKMDGPALRTCITSEKYKNAVQTDVMDAMKVGATGTPSFVIGKSTENGVAGEVLIGAQPFEAFDVKLKELAAGK